jgi:hypothetical protein
MKIKKKSKNFFLKIAGILINQTNGKLCATHPLELETTEGNAILYGHISAENPQVEGLQNNDEVLIFQDLTVIFLPRGMIMKMCQHGIILPFMCMEKSNY